MATKKHTWTFSRRFRRSAFGWKSQPAMTRLKEAVSEIKAARRKDPGLAAEGAVLLIEKISPAFAHVDSSSGSIGNAVNRALEELVPIVSEAPVDADTHRRWMNRLWQAYEADDIPYIEDLGDMWGDLCPSKEVASEWADRLLPGAKTALTSGARPRPFSQHTSPCLSSLLRAGRHEEVVALLRDEDFWPYKRWAVKALIAMGKRSEALRTAESCRGQSLADRQIDLFCEEILLSSGMTDEAYRRYGLAAARAGTYLAWFRAVRKKYPDKPPETVLADLVAFTPGEEGKWFAAAKQAGLYDKAIELARRSPCDPRTLTRAARDFEKKQPGFAMETGLAALRWLVEGHGYEITGRDVYAAQVHTIRAAEQAGRADEARERIGKLLAGEAPRAGFLRDVLGEMDEPLDELDELD